MIFTGQETVADIMITLPEASEILASHGLGCTSCSLSQIENLKDGVLSHGFTEQDLERILADLNEAAEDEGISQINTQDLPPRISKEALSAISRLQQEMEMKNKPLRIEVEIIESEKNYFIDFCEKPERNDIIVGTPTCGVILDPPSYRLLKNMIIDYRVENKEEGFVFEKI